MRLQIASDLHLEHFQQRWPGFQFLTPDPTADALLLPGDIAQGLQIVQLFSSWPVPVLYVPGNHEFYGFDKERLTAELREKTKGTAIRFLQNDAVELLGARFLGATFWTDYQLFPEHTPRAMSHANRALADHHWIQNGAETFHPKHALAEHRASRAWLDAELDKPFDGPTVVLTHHAPHMNSVHERWSRDLLSAAFASDCSELMGRAQLWAHGHVHDCFDYTVKGTRVIANPRGYSVDFKSARAPADLKVWENPHFNPSLVVEI